MPYRLFLLLAVTTGILCAGWLDVESITNRPESWDLTCENNARAVVCDTFGSIHVVWRGQVGGTFQVSYMRCPLDSTRWRDTTILSNDTAPASAPCLALDSSGDLHVAWTSGDSIRLASRDGATGEWMRHAPLRGFRDDSAVSMAADAQGAQHLVWLRGGGSSACVCYANHNASGWHDHDTVGVTHSNIGVGRASIAASGSGDLMVVWKDVQVDDVVLARRRSQSAWQDSEVVYDSARCRSPCVAWLPDSSWHVVWTAGGSRGDGGVLWSFRAGDTWSANMRVSIGCQRTLSSSIAADGGGALLVGWAGELDPGPTYTQVLCRRRSRTGEWSAQESLARGPASARQRVSVANASRACQVVWTENGSTQDPPAVRLRRYVMVHDVAVEGIVVPSDTADSGRAFVGVRAPVRNCGEYAEDSVVVLLRGGGDSSRCTLAYLGVGAVDTARFDSCPAVQRGPYVIMCSTSVAGDRQPGNDVRRDTLFVRVLDVAVADIVSPDTVVNADSVRPVVRARNDGNVPASLRCHVWIDSAAYHDSVLLLVGAGGEQVCSLELWRGAIGWHAMRCSLAYVGDLRPENNTAGRQFRVVRRDVGVERILCPAGVVDSGRSWPPRAVVRNYGTEVEILDVRCAIGDFYVDVATVDSLAPGGTAEVEFDEWTALARGWQAVRCSTMLDGDRVEGNNACRDSVFVRVLDAAVEEILYPRERISRGDVRVRARVANHGNASASVPVSARIWTDSAELSSDTLWVELEPGRDSVAEFQSWYAGTSGDYWCGCSTGLEGDMLPVNDTVTQPFHVVRIDAALLEVVRPLDTVVEGRIEPLLRVANQSEESGDLWAFVRITGGNAVAYLDSAVRTMPGDDTASIGFRGWGAERGAYHVAAWVSIAGDSNSANDSLFRDVVVESLESRRWIELASMPAGPRGRGVAAGGSMAAAGDELFVVKGGNTLEFLYYRPDADTWGWLPMMDTGPSGRKVKCGATLTSDGSTVFALKGNHTREFWVYSVRDGTWSPGPELPVGTSTVKYGAGLAFVPSADTDKVYCVKGSGGLEFLVYWCGPSEWHSRRPLPAAPGGRKARRGTALGALGARLFCTKGGTSEFYEYVPSRDTWLTCASLPVSGRSGRFRKCRDGAALVGDGTRSVYALKGGGCSEFWRYDAAGDSWSQLDDVPMGNGGSRVKAGAALAWVSGRVFALKGGRTRELWCFDPLAARIPAPVPAAELCGGDAMSGLGSSEATIQTAPAHGQRAAGTEVLDACGRKMKPGAPGVYFIVGPGGSGRVIRRLVLVR